MKSELYWAFVLLVGCIHFAYVESHARLLSPPGRSSMWRAGFPTLPNYNDNELYCGGYFVQWSKNGGKCGVCGDPYQQAHPRDNEAGGKYGVGLISAKYTAGEIIDVVVDVTTNHRGYFEFKLCPNNNVKKEVTQECLDKHVLKLPDGDSKVDISKKGSGKVVTTVQLPKGLTCSQCVFQWTYTTGNNWGRCEDGTSKVGCGPQETFRGCADIEIQKSTGKEIIQKPAISEITQKPTRKEITAKPTRKEITVKPTKKEITQKPTSNEMTQKPRACIKNKFSNDIQSNSIDYEDNEEQRSDSKNPNNIFKKTINPLLADSVNYNNAEFVDPETSPYFNSKNFLFAKSSLAALKNLDFRNSYFIVPATNTISDVFKSKTKENEKSDSQPDILKETNSKSSLDDKNEMLPIQKKSIVKKSNKPLLFLTASDKDSLRENNPSAAEGIVLDGRTYKDFWFL